MLNIKEIESALLSKYWSWVYLDATLAPSSLLDALKSHLPHIQENSWPDRFAWGGIFVNGKEAFSDLQLTTPCRIEYYEPKLSLTETRNNFPAWQDDFVIFQDKQIAVVFKPAHLPSMPAREQRHYSLKRYMDEYFKCTVHMPSRLDFSVSGLVVVSLSPETHGTLQKAYENRLAKKSYLLLASQTPHWDCASAISKISKSKIHAAVQSCSLTEGLDSRTSFKKICKVGEFQALLAQPITGRTHQIRIHAADLGFPIVGDRFYGGLASEKLHLLSYQIALNHPLTGSQIKVDLPSRFHPDWLNTDLTSKVVQYLENKP